MISNFFSDSPHKAKGGTGHRIPLSILLAGITLAAPFIASAQRTISTIIQTFIDLIEFTIPLIMTLAVAVFFFGGARFIWGAENEQARSQGKMFLLWGVLGLFVMVSVWGIVLLIEATFFT